MKQLNPYEPPPACVNAKSEFVPRFDAGLLTARYLQFFGILSILSFFTKAFFFDEFMLDLSPIFLFWAAKNLERHGRTTRSWILVICWMGLTINLVMFFLTVVLGTEDVSMSVFGSEITNPELWQVALMVCVFFALFGIPVWLLNTREAKHEFGLPNTG